MRRLLLFAVVLVLGCFGVIALPLATNGSAATPPSTGPYAPLDRPGPALDVPAAQLAASLTCSGDLAGGQEPVLLVPGTTQTPDVNFAWNYEKGFTQQGRPWCAVTLPNHAMSDIQTAGEYVVSAIRTEHARSGKKVEIVGYSQGGMVPRWALRFWPDTRAMVDDDVAIDPSNQGTLDANGLCTITAGCAPAIWQQEYGSHFLAALNSGTETFAGISYTVVYSDTDEVVFPNVGPGALSRLPAASNVVDIPVQSICPTDVSEHLAMGTVDPVAYAVVQDAITHAGPASAARIPSTTCSEVFSPPVDRATALVNLARVTALAGYEVATYPHVSAEPALAAYTKA